MTTESTIARTVEEATIVVEYGPVRPNHENRLLTALTEFNEAGLLIESSFETGKFTVCIDLMPGLDDAILDQSIKNTLKEVYGDVAVAQAHIAVSFDYYDEFGE